MPRRTQALAGREQVHPYHWPAFGLPARPDRHLPACTDPSRSGAVVAKADASPLASELLTTGRENRAGPSLRAAFGAAASPAGSLPRPVHCCGCGRFTALAGSLLLLVHCGGRFTAAAGSLLLPVHCGGRFTAAAGSRSLLR